MNVGGKLLTNYLKEVVSYRQWNMMDEFEVLYSCANVYHEPAVGRLPYGMLQYLC